MKVTRKKVFDQLIKELEEVSHMQKSGACMLTQKTGYALSKNLKAAYAIVDEFNSWREAMMPKYIVFEKGRPLTEKDETTQRQRYVFINDELKDEYHRIITEHCEQQIDWLSPHKVELTEVQACQNLPLTAICMLEEFEIITELNLSSNGILGKGMNVVN